MAGSSAKIRSKRHLVRWNACNLDGTKINWRKVGELMEAITNGGPITEGAIVQHLAKLRLRMEEEGLPVPPSLKRGGRARTAPATSSSISRSIKSPIIGSSHRVDKANRRRPVTLNADSAATNSNVKTRKASIAKKDTKKARKSTSSEEVDSELDGDYVTESDSDAWKPPSRLTKSSGKEGKKTVGKPFHEEDSETSSSSAGEKHTHSSTKIGVGEPCDDGDDEGDGNYNGEDSDDKTVSLASNDFVAKNASFLPGSSITKTSPLSDRPESLVVTLNWGNAYSHNLESYDLALANLIERGIIQPGAHEVRHYDEEVGQYEEDVNVGPKNYSLTQYQVDEDAIDNLHNDGQFNEATQDPHDYHTYSNSTEVSHRFGGFPEPGQATFHNNDLANLAQLSANPANYPSQAIGGPPYPPTLDFGGPDFQTHPHFNASVMDNRFGQDDTFDPQNHDSFEQYGRFDTASFGGAIHTPFDTNFSPVGPGIQFHSNVNSDLSGYQADGFYDGGVNSDLGYAGHTTYAHGDIHTGFHCDGHSRMGSDNTVSTEASSVTGYYAENVSSQAQTLYQSDPDFETNETIPGADEQTLDLGANQWNFDDSNLELDLPETFDFDPFL